MCAQAHFHICVCIQLLEYPILPSVRHKKAGLQLFPAYRFRQERLNSNSRVAFDHQIVIIIIKIVFGCRNMKFWPTFASKVTIFNDSGSTFEMSGSGQIEFFSSNGSKILTSQGPGVMALLFGFWAQFGTFFDKSGSEKHPCRCPWRRGNVAPVERNAQGSTPDHPWSL